MTLSIFTIYVLISNGLVLGGVMALMQVYGHAAPLHVSANVVARTLESKSAPAKVSFGHEPKFKMAYGQNFLPLAHAFFSQRPFAPCCQ